MSWRFTNIGVQLMPNVFVVCAVAFYALGSTVLCAGCIALGVFFWLLIWSEKKPKK